MRPLCEVCRLHYGAARKKKTGERYFATKCDKCSRSPESYKAKRIKDKERLIRENKPWVMYKKDHCEECGFVALHACQLSVDHIDGSKDNNDESNYKTLCHNCHALKTMLNGDWYNIKYRSNGQNVLH